MKIAYICNLKRFCNDSCGCIANGGECSHTLDVTFAKNYGVLSWIDEQSLTIFCDKDENALLGSFFGSVELDNSKKCVYISPQKRAVHANKYGK